MTGSMTGATDRFTVLVVDDEPAILNSLKRYLALSGYRLLLAENGEIGLALLADNKIDLMLLDLKMPGMNGLEVLERAKRIRPNLKVIMQTGHGGVQEAVLAMRSGALDFLVKGESIEIFQSRIRQVFENWKLERENSALRNNKELFQFDGLVGDSAPMQQLKKLIVRVAPTDTTVLIQGESGTGKELIAQALHHHSERRDKPFIAVDCASISESLLESELFGHVKGAFTGADNASPGLIRSADSGTLFLDEIGEISLAVQAKLLRTIQERLVRPVGSTKIHQTDVRIIAATNRNLLDEVSLLTFRRDLYYRISAVTLTAPALRERCDDIPLLTKYILDQYVTVQGDPVIASPETLDIFSRYDWPGNVRELENVLRRGAVFSDTGILQPEDLPPMLQVLSGSENSVDENTTVRAFEKEAIINALALTKNNRKEAVKMLGISESTLYRKIKKYKL